MSIWALRQYIHKPIVEMSGATADAGRPSTSNSMLSSMGGRSGNRNNNTNTNNNANDNDKLKLYYKRKEVNSL